MATVTEDPKAITDTFRKHFRRVCFATHAYNGQRIAKWIESSFKGQRIDKGITKPRLSLLPDDLEDKLSAARQKLTQTLNTYTFPCKARASRLISLTSCEPFVARWKEVVAEYDAVADLIANSRDEIYNYNRTHWLPIFDNDEAKFEEHIGKLIPPKENLRGRFSVQHWLDDAAEIDEQFVSTIVGEFFEEAAANREAIEFAVIQDAVLAPRSYAMALRRLRFKLDEGKKITDKSLTEARMVAQQCFGMVDVIAPRIMVTIRNLDTVLNEAQNIARSLAAVGSSVTAYFKGRKVELFTKIDAAIATCENESLQEPIMEKFGVSMFGARPLTYDDEDNEG